MFDVVQVRSGARVVTDPSRDGRLTAFGKATLSDRYLMPGESYVEYQLLAQKLRPDSFVMTVGYGECATGYVPTEKAIQEEDTNLSDWCWVAPGAEKAITEALTVALRPKGSHP